MGRWNLPSGRSWWNEGSEHVLFLRRTKKLILIGIAGVSLRPAPVALGDRTVLIVHCRLALIPFATVCGLWLAACAGNASQKPYTYTAASGAPDFRAPCEDALFDTSATPSHRLKAPDSKLVTPPDFHGPARALQAAAAHGMGADACATKRFFVAADGTVQNIKPLADYPPGFGFGDAVATGFAVAKYPPSAAGGPYGIDIQAKAHRKLAPTS